MEKLIDENGRPVADAVRWEVKAVNTALSLLKENLEDFCDTPVWFESNGGTDIFAEIKDENLPYAILASATEAGRRYDLVRRGATDEILQSCATFEDALHFMLRTNLSRCVNEAVAAAKKTANWEVMQTDG